MTILICIPLSKKCNEAYLCAIWLNKILFDYDSSAEKNEMEAILQAFL